MMDAVQTAWKQRRFVRWVQTQWCNYSCDSYCRQDHARSSLYRGQPAHFADNRPWQDWALAFQHHFGDQELSMHITGGEPMLDRRNFVPLLKALTAMPKLVCISLDSNGTFDPDFGGVDKSKLALTLSWHHTVTPLDAFRRRLDSVLAAGWTVTYIAIVVLPGGVGLLRDAAHTFAARGIPVSANPLDGARNTMAESELAEIAEFIPLADRFRAGIPTAGNSCLYPSLAYEIEPSGAVTVACHRTLGAQYHGSLWDEKLPELFDGYTSCPRENCSCTERYTFQESLQLNTGLNPKVDYSNRLKGLQLC